MGRPQVKNFAIVTVNGTYTAGATTSILLTTGHGANLPTPNGYYLVWWNDTDYANNPYADPNKEIIFVVARSGDTLSTITRGQDGTSATAKNTAGKTYKMELVANAGIFDDIYLRLLKPGAGYLSYVSTTSIRLDPFNGALLPINSVPEQIPDAGVALSNASLVADTLYRIYAYINSSGAMTLEASATAHTIQSLTGVEIKSGDGTRTLVGLVEMNASAQFDSRFLASWYNPIPKVVSATLGADRTTTSTSFAEICQSSERVGFVTFAGVAVRIDVIGAHLTSSGTVYSSIGIDTGTVAQEVSSLGNTAYSGIGISFQALPAEGYHYATIVGRVSAGTGTWKGGSTVGERTKLQVTYLG